MNAQMELLSHREYPKTKNSNGRKWNDKIVVRTSRQHFSIYKRNDKLCEDGSDAYNIVIPAKINKHVTVHYLCVRYQPEKRKIIPDNEYEFDNSEFSFEKVNRSEIVGDCQCFRFSFMCRQHFLDYKNKLRWKQEDLYYCIICKNLSNRCICSIKGHDKNKTKEVLPKPDDIDYFPSEYKEKIFPFIKPDTKSTTIQPKKSEPTKNCAIRAYEYILSWFKPKPKKNSNSGSEDKEFTSIGQEFKNKLSVLNPVPHLRNLYIYIHLSAFYYYYKEEFDKLQFGDEGERKKASSLRQKVERGLSKLCSGVSYIKKGLDCLTYENIIQPIDNAILHFMPASLIENSLFEFNEDLDTTPKQNKNPVQPQPVEYRSSSFDSGALFFEANDHFDVDSGGIENLNLLQPIENVQDLTSKKISPNNENTTAEQNKNENTTAEQNKNENTTAEQNKNKNTTAEQNKNKNTTAEQNKNKGSYCTIM